MYKDFFESIKKVNNELCLYGKNKDATINELDENYNKLSREQKKFVIEDISNMFKTNNGYNAIFLMSTILCILPVKEVVNEIEYLLLDRRFPLWIRVNCMYQLNYKIFSNNIRNTDKLDDELDYQRRRDIYKLVSSEVKKYIKTSGYIPIEKRAKKVIIVICQLLSMEHAPTRKALHISSFFEKLGYKVQFAVFDIRANDISNMWMGGGISRNFTNENGLFRYNIFSKNIEGYNLQIEYFDDLKNIQGIVDYIYDSNPEFVFEMGDMTLISDICNSFTDVVTMKLTKSVPISNSKFIVRYFRYTKEEDIEFRGKLSADQIVIDVPHVSTNSKVLNSKIKYSKKDFGIDEESFLVIIAGNRLQIEITEEFLKILYRILKIDNHICIALIGEAKLIKDKIKSEFEDRFYFLGIVDDFLETIAIGDIFLNPPRQGGGTGGLYAMRSQVPVITLDQCDVEAVSGKEFVCDSLDDMVGMVEKYYTDSEFMNKQKEICKISSEQWFNADSIGNFKKMIDIIHENSEKDLLD